MVRVRVRERGGEIKVIGEGEWEEVYTPVLEEGYNNLILYIYISFYSNNNENFDIFIYGESERKGRRKEGHWRRRVGRSIYSCY